MKITTKVAAAMIGLVFAGSAVKAQSLDDAKKAITAEQYQKAKSMLKNLTVTQADKDENYFYLGWVYLQQDEIDSAKMIFNKGVGVNPKSALNYVGLGAVALLDKDKATATTNFNLALSNTSKKDSKPYEYIGRSYLLGHTGISAMTPADAQAATDVITKGQMVDPKDPGLDVALGNVYLTQLRSTDAFNQYQNAQALDPKSPAIEVALGVIAKYANNYTDAEGHFQAALAIDPNFGPAYREWAETDLRWGLQEPKFAAKKQEAVQHYQKYLSLTDMSVESQMRFADFLLFAHDQSDYQMLQQVATDLSKSANSNLKVYRYIAMSAYENKDYANGLTAMNTWMTKADPKRITSQDYLYLGHLQAATGADSLGMLNLQKAYALDTTNVDALEDIAKSLYIQKKYKLAGDEYALYISKYPKYNLNDLFKEGNAYYFAYDTKDPKADTTLLTKADTAFSRIQQKATAPVPTVAIYRAFVGEAKDKDRDNIHGYAKPFYEQYIAIIASKPTLTDLEKKNLVTAYDYLGAYYEFKMKDDVKAEDNFSKALAISPTDAQALDFQKRKGKK